MAWPWPRPRRALVASAARGSVAGGAASARGASWQDEAFNFYDTLGEIHEAAKFAARPLSKLELKLEERVDGGEWEDSENPEAQALLDRIKGADGTRSELFFAYGQLMFLAGECYLVASVTEDGDETWEFLSTAELKPAEGEPGVYKRYAYPGAQPTILRERADDLAEPVDGEAAIYRFWRRHPRYSSAADAPMRGVLTICGELEVLTKAVRGEAVSRLARAGVLLIPNEASMPSLEAGPDEDPEEDPFIATVMEAVREAVRNPESATSMIPVTLRVDGDTIDKFRHITFGNGAEGYPEAKLRDEAITRLAIGLDMPVEALTGSQGANHWNLWLIDDQSWRVHVQPLADLLVSNLTATVFRPELEAAGVADPTMFRIAYDASSIVTNSDKSRDAKDLHDRGAISDTAVREAAGFDDEDMPTVESPNSNPRVILALGRAAGYGGPSEETGSPTPASPTPEPDGVTKLPPNQGEPPALAASASLEARIEGAAHVAVERCRELAGSKIISRAAGHPSVAAQVRKVPKHLVACALGEAVVLDVIGDLTPADLVAGGADTFRSTLLAWGLSEAEAVEMAMLVEAHAAGTLFAAEAACAPPMLERGRAA